MNCSYCSADLIRNHTLEDLSISPMKNGSRMIYPLCSICGHPIQIADIPDCSLAERKVILISGTAAAGKTTIGQMLEQQTGCIFIDGDAVSKRINHLARLDTSIKVQGDIFHTETIKTMLIVLALGYTVVVGYVIGPKILAQYLDALDRYGVTPIIRVLVPERSACLARDLDRACWTAGARWIDQWYDEQRSYLSSHPSWCIDSTNETLNETLRHFLKLI